MRSLVRRPAAFGAVFLALAAAMTFGVPTCGGTPEPVRPIVLDGEDQGDAPEEEGSDGRHDDIDQSSRGDEGEAHDRDLNRNGQDP